MAATIMIKEAELEERTTHFIFRDRPRKEGGYGNAGNTKDAEKYVKDGEEAKQDNVEGTTELEVTEVEPEPVKQTLEEYYKSKGVDMTYNSQAKSNAKKNQIDAEWIKKEKLTVLKTKEDLRNQEKSEQSIKPTVTKIEQDDSDLKLCGFGNKLAPKHQKA
jgi:hypothetical protein